jgi:hypothetical protein
VITLALLVAALGGGCSFGSSSDDAARAALAARNNKVKPWVQGAPEFVQTGATAREEITAFANDAACFLVDALSESGYADEERLRSYVSENVPVGLFFEADSLTRALISLRDTLLTLNLTPEELVELTDLICQAKQL